MSQDALSESQVPSPSLSKKQWALLELAKKRLAAVDVKSDGEGDGDEPLREEALKYIRKECLSLPDTEFLKLLSKIEGALKRKDVEAGLVRNESKTALKEISDELSLLPVSNFDADVANPDAVADYLADRMSIRDGSDEFLDKLKQNPKCAAGFVRNWNAEHPVRKSLEKRWFATAEIVNALSIAHGTLSAEFTNNDGAKKDFEKTVEERNGALRQFEELVRNGFPNPNDPKTAEAFAEIFEKWGQFACDGILKILKSDEKLALGMIEVWEMGGKNPVRAALSKHPDDWVRQASDFLDGAKSILAESYGFDAYNLPDDFWEVAKDQLERFERRGNRAKEVAKWNAENRKYLTEKWNAVVMARMRWDSASTVKIWMEIEDFFDTKFRAQQDQANEWFYGLVGGQQPDAYLHIQALAGTRQLFMTLRNTYGDESNAMSAQTAVTPEIEKDIRQYDAAFRSAIGGNWGTILVRNEKWNLAPRDFSDFVREAAKETDVQNVRDPEWLARYVSYALSRWWKREFSKILRSDFGNKYDAFVLKLADISWKLSKWNGERTKDWGNIEQTLMKSDLNASDALDEFISKESDEILKNRRAIESGDLGTVRNVLKSKMPPEKMKALFEALKWKSTREQFELLLDACPSLSHGDVEAIFTEVSKKSKDASAAYGREADRIIPGGEIMEYVPWFVHLRFALADAVEGETPEEAGKRKSLLKELQKENRLTASEFFEKYGKYAEYFAKTLDRKAATAEYAKTGCENFASWLRSKASSGAKFKDAVTSKSLADEAKKLAAGSGPEGKASDRMDQYGETISQGERLWESLLRAKERADALESAGKTEEAAQLRARVFGDSGWSPSSDLPNLETARSAVEKLEKENGFWLGDAKRRMEGPVAENGKPGIDTVSGAHRSSPEYVASVITAELAAGRTVRVPIGSESTTVTVTKTGDGAEPYRVSVDGKESFFCTDENLAANLQMADLLSRNGLAFLAPVSGELLRRSSVAKGNLATAADGDFGDREKRELLSVAAKALKIEDFPHASTDLSEMSARLSRISRDEHSSVRELAIRNGVLDESGNLKNREEFLASAT